MNMRTLLNRWRRLAAKEQRTKEEKIEMQKLTKEVYSRLPPIEIYNTQAGQKLRKILKKHKISKDL